VVADRDVWRLNLELLPSQPSRTWAGFERRRTILQGLLRITIWRTVCKFV